MTQARELRMCGSSRAKYITNMSEQCVVDHEDGQIVYDSDGVFVSARLPASERLQKTELENLDALLVGANIIKFPSGGWFAIAIAFGAFVVMATWVQGNYIIGKKLAEDSQPIHDFIANLWDGATPRVPGTAVFLTTNYNTPIALKHFVEHAHVLHEQVVLMTITSSNLPVVPPARQIRVEWLPDGLWKITALCGFMESPNIPRFLARARAHGFDFKPDETTYFARRTSVVPTGTSRMARWRKRLFAALSRNSSDATRSFNLPPDRVVDFGAQVEL